LNDFFSKDSKGSYYLNGLKIETTPGCLITYLQIHYSQKLDVQNEKRL